MTLRADILTNSDGSPSGRVRISCTNPNEFDVQKRAGNSPVVSFVEDLRHFGSFAGEALEQVKQAEANSDPEG